MNSKNIFLVALGALCGLAIAPGMAQAKDREVSGRYAQSSVTDPDANTSDDTVEGKGTFGKLTSRAFTRFSDPGAPSANCEGFDFEASFESGSFVNTYNDMSQFYAVITSGYLCGDVDGARRYVIEADIVGGSGRFEGATGAITLHAEGTAFSPDMGAFQGTYSGTVSLDD